MGPSAVEIYIIQNRNLIFPPSEGPLQIGGLGQNAPFAPASRRPCLRVYLLALRVENKLIKLGLRVSRGNIPGNPYTVCQGCFLQVHQLGSGCGWKGEYCQVFSLDNPALSLKVTKLAHIVHEIEWLNGRE